MPLHHKLDMFDVDLHLVTTTRQFDTVCRKVSRYGDKTPADWDPWDSVGRVQTFHSGDGTDGTPEYHVVIALDVRVFNHPDTPPAYAVRICAHEATHAARIILDHIGQTFEPECELAASLTGWITEWLWGNVTDR